MGARHYVASPPAKKERRKGGGALAHCTGRERLAGSRRPARLARRTFINSALPVDLLSSSIVRSERVPVA